MIQFNIIGKGYLHLEKSGGLGFKADNQCFRFCDISLGRSSEFNAVDDEYNRTLLDLGGDPAMYGGMLRRRWPCQLQYDGGQVMGTLAVTGWSKGAFSCVFYMDDADWIRKIQETKMADLPVGSSYYLTWDAGYHPAPANQAGLPALSIVSYEDPGLFGGTGQLIPSMEVKAYLDLIAAYIGKPVTGIDADEFRLVLGTANGAGEHSVTIDITASNAATVTGGVNDFTVEDVTLEWARSNILGVYVGGGSSTVKGFKALRNLEITFPNTAPNDCYLVRWNSSLGQCVVIAGGASDPLASKTVKMTKGNIYVFVANGWISVDTNGSFYGWKDIYHPLTLTCTVSALEALTLGDVWSLQYNQPDMTIFEFLKSVALATGRDLIVNTDGIELSSGNTGKDNYVDLKRIVSIESVTRRVEAWGGVRKAVVGFDSEDYVVDPITSEWDIDNDQLEDEADARSKFSEGTQGDYGIAIYDQTLENGVGKVVARRCTIGRIDPNDTHLQRVLPPDYPSCGDIADNSTCVVVKTLAPEMEFFALKPYDYIMARGQMYRWMSGEWSDGIMTLTLQKVSQASQAIVPPKKEYIQDGLVLHMDGIEKGDTPNAWTSMVGSYVFASNGGVTFGDDHVSFNGIDSYLINNDFLAPESDTATIEVVFAANNVGCTLIAARSDLARIGLTIDSSNRFLWSSKTSKYSYNAVAVGSVSINGSRCLINGVNTAHNGSTYYLTSTAMAARIGGKYSSGANNSFFEGKIYSIRIYNRRLTTDEQLNNLAVDIERFGIGS